MYLDLYLRTVALTTETYPNLKRGNFDLLSDKDIQAFQAILSKG